MIRILLPLIKPINSATVDFATDLYLENSVVPSDRDDPDLYMLG